MQRLFSTFPDGVPGIGLLCLRIGVVVPLAWYAVTQLPAITLDVAGAVAGILLFAGLWTPLAGGVMAITELWIAFTQRGDLWAHILLATIGAGLAMLGPGAWSVDSRLFGRRRFHIGSGSRPPLK